ncbi:hypothetical protein LTR28_006679 [Elasticomyces elasticus]|nr:hypothetical protein LTR28_006679 [Elasticomyces elasticus]
MTVRSPFAPIAAGDLNNTQAVRATIELELDPSYLGTTLAITASEDAAYIRQTYRPFLLDDETTRTDWVSRLELSTALKMMEEGLRKAGGGRLNVLVIFGSCDVRVFDPSGLPIKDDVQHSHPKVQELRELSKWSDGHVWVSPEQHGNLSAYNPANLAPIYTAVFKNQIDWIPLSTGSVRPTQGRTLAIAQVSGGSQSFNTVNSLRLLGRWMRMFAIPNQSSVPMAYTQFTDTDAADGGSRMVPSGNRDRLVDCMEGFVKYTIVMRPHFDLFSDRFSEKTERAVAREKKANLAAAAAAAASASKVTKAD